jgi:hypothetical protein
VSLRFDQNGWLVAGSDPSVPVDTSIVTRKGYSQFATADGRPEGIVWHWTSGSSNTSSSNRDGLGTSLRDYMLKEVVDPDRKASWNFYLDKFGRIYQHASVLMPTWTTGAPRCAYWNPQTNKIERSKSDINRHLLGIEMENAGGLRFINGKAYRWPVYKKGTKELDPNSVVNSDRAVLASNGKHYDAWTPAQIQSAQALIIALRDFFGWNDPRYFHYSHEQFAQCGGGAKGKTDPGWLWMEDILPQLEQNALGAKVTGDATTGSIQVIAAKENFPWLVAAVALLGVGLYMRKKRRG